MTILLTPEDAADQTVVLNRKTALTAQLKKILKLYGDGSEAKGVVMLADGIHVEYVSGLHRVFTPTTYSGRVTDGETPGTFVAQLDTPQGSQPA